jgi:putative transposase
VIEATRHLLEAIVMLETLPVQAGLVARAQDWCWSSAPHHLGQVRDGLITEHPLHWMLGNTPFDRERAHANLLERGLDSAAAGRLDLAVRRSLALGSEAFVSRIASVTGRQFAPRARGRPRAQKAV